MSALSKRIAVSSTALMLLVLVAAPAGASGQELGKTLIEHWTGAKWIKVSSPSPSGGDLLNGVDALTSANAWAVGQHGNVNSAHPLIEHWNGSAWISVAGGSTPAGSWLDSVTMISPTSGWAVGRGAFGQSGQPVIERWDGAKWILAADPSVPGGELFGVDAVGESNVWAVGGDGAGGTLIEHWDGASWSVVPSPDPGEVSYLRSVTAISAGDVWAVGSTAPHNKPDQTLTLHWNGSTWAVVKSFLPGGSDLSAVTARGSKDVFAAGTTTTNQGCLQTLVLHWGGSSWKRMTTPNPFSCDNELAGIGASSKGVEAVGTRPQNCPGSACKGVTLTMHLKNGSWKVQSSPSTAMKVNRLFAVAMVPGKNQGWAVGLATNTLAG
jgi:hypothetical protein